MSRSIVQFNLRPGVGGVPPIVSVPRNWKWFATRLVPGFPATAVVNEGRVYRDPDFGGTLSVEDIPGKTLNLAEVATQYVVLEIEQTLSEIPIQSLFTPASYPDLDAEFGFTVEANPIATNQPEDMYGAQSKALFVEIGTIETKLVTTLTSKHVILAEITQTLGGYTLKQRHEGAVFIFPAVWPGSQTYNW